jgi:lysophospholipase L1-like esterase
VSYPLPVPATQHPPVSVACAPGPEAPLPVGSNFVVCTAVDSVGSASCTFRVDVTRPARQIKYTRFLAFGDSQTEGFLREPPEWELVRMPLYVSPTENYPYKLQAMLRQRYGRDDIVVINEGLGGETVIEAQDRIIRTIANTTPQVLLLLHGYNEVRNIPLADARDAFRAIIRSAQVRGVEVALATLFQVSDALEESRPGTQDLIADLNARLRSLAASLDLPGVVDLEVAFGQEGSWLGSDGLHPTPSGYQLVAETFRDHLINRFEEAPAPPVEQPPPPSTPLARYSIQRSGH